MLINLYTVTYRHYLIAVLSLYCITDPRQSRGGKESNSIPDLSVVSRFFSRGFRLKLNLIFVITFDLASVAIIYIYR